MQRGRKLNGKIPVKARGELIRKFETNPGYKIFLSTEAGGSGLNLQIADTLINFELPWNPAKKNQRIGRIDRLGQKSSNLTIINFITCNSIEMQIASGLLVKQSLFDGVLGDDAATNFVDFSSKGRSQFIICSKIEEQKIDFGVNQVSRGQQFGISILKNQKFHIHITHISSLLKIVYCLSIAKIWLV